MVGKSKLSTYQEQVSHMQRVGRPGEKFYVGGRGGHAPHPPYLNRLLFFKTTLSKIYLMEP